MARFPKAEAKVMQLAQAIINGLETYPQEFRNAPVSAERLTQGLNGFVDARNGKVAADARALEETKRKNRTLAELIQLMKADLTFAEGHTRRDPVRLNMLGWGPPRPARDLEPPGEIRRLHIVEETENAITLAWRKPVDGGRPAAYRVECRQGGKGPWGVVATPVPPRATVTDQPRGIELEYRVVGINRAGLGPPGRTVQAVL